MVWREIALTETKADAIRIIKKHITRGENPASLRLRKKPTGYYSIQRDETHGVEKHFGLFGA